MGANPRNETTHRRVRLDGVVPVEIWDLVIDGGTLFDHRRRADFPRLLARAVEQLRDGRASTRSNRGGLEVCRGIEFAFIGGGGESLIQALPIPLCVSRAGAFVGEAGGRALLAQMGREGIIVDVGQTSLKISTPRQRFQVVRDLERLPLAAEVPESEWPVQRERLRVFLAKALRQLDRSRIEAVVMALPCEVDGAGVPGECTYAGMRGDATLVRDVLGRAGLVEVPVILLNDAELAAVSARLCPEVPRDRKVLVLTLGLGVGAAVLT